LQKAANQRRIVLRLLALLPLRSLQRIRDALAECDYAHGMEDVNAMLALMSGTQCWDVIVIDPDLCGRLECDLILSKAGDSRAAIVLDSHLSSAGQLAAVVGRTSAVVLTGHDDGPSELRHLFESLPAPCLELRLLHRLVGRFDALPLAPRRAAMALFSPSHRIQSTKHLVRESGIGRRSLDRWMTHVGLRPARWLVAAARLAGAYGPLSGGAATLREVAVEHGYGSVRTLNRQALMLTGYGPRALARNLSEQQLLGRLEVAVINPGERVAERS
jgi:AraC-like DNA-binding protein